LKPRTRSQQPSREVRLRQPRPQQHGTHERGRGEREDRK
jgi:hypothetical protein